MAEIEVSRAADENVYVVRVEDGTGSSEHRVTATPEQLESLGAAGDPEALLEESFRFLLEREPRSAILSRFELPVISSYFPEYEEEIRRRMD